MTIWYRAAQIENVQTVFSGEGGLHTVGRWNHLGRRAIYCSESISLCTLEWLSHNGLSVSGFSYYRYSIDVPDNVTVRFSATDLPREWNAVPATDTTRDWIEKNFFSSSQALAIAVPSVMVPEEFNLVINPLHLEFVKAAKTIQSLGQYQAPKR